MSITFLGPKEVSWPITERCGVRISSAPPSRESYTLCLQDLRACTKVFCTCRTVLAFSWSFIGHTYKYEGWVWLSLIGPCYQIGNYAKVDCCCCYVGTFSWPLTVSKQGVGSINSQADKWNNCVQVWNFTGLLNMLYRIFSEVETPQIWPLVTSVC